MLFPKKVKHRKWQKGRARGQEAKRGNYLAFGSYGLKALTDCWLTARQIEAARRAMTRYVQRGGKGSVDHYVVPVKPGRIIFEMDGVSEEMAKEAMRRASYKLPIKTRFITR